MNRRIKALGMLAAAGVMLASANAHAVSDGNYSYKFQHCSGYADNVERDNYAEDGCHNFTMTVSDLSGHEYFGIGFAQTVDHEKGVIPDVLPFGIGANLHRFEMWWDIGKGCHRVVTDLATPSTPPTHGPCPWMNPAAPNYWPQFNAKPHPATGLRIYFGADDNAAGGEHDSSELINNGPSDGGGIHVIMSPAQASAWLAALMAHNLKYIVTHPLPIGDAGIGACADGICMSVQTQQQVAYQGGSSSTPPRDVSNYNGHRWDPTRCSGDDDGSLPTDTACNDPNNPSQHQDITYWNNQNGTVYAEPGVQIFEDPDPQGSPIGPYPLPALYIGTCGVVIGGGPVHMPASPFSNDAGQWVIGKNC